jgi:hypothetical protein
MLQKIICWFKGHTKLEHDTEHTSHYIRIPAGREAFCRDPERYEYAGRLYRCARCGELLLVRGILEWELVDLLEATLQNFPGNVFKCFGVAPGKDEKTNQR